MKSKRSGTGYWIDLLDKEDGNFVECEWTNDAPNGDFTWYNYVFLIEDEKQVIDAHGTVIDGLYDGDFKDGFWEGAHFDSGKIKVIRTLSGAEYKYAIADRSSGYCTTNQAGVDGTYGLYGYGTP